MLLLFFINIIFYFYFMSPNQALELSQQVNNQQSPKQRSTKNTCKMNQIGSTTQLQK